MSIPEPYICRMRPHFRPKVWGGRTLAEVFDKPLPANRDIGESWEVSDMHEGQSAVDNGPLAGLVLSELVHIWGSRLVGDGQYTDRFPLLVKILDAQDDLSVQVHPSAQHVREHFPDEEPKDECWLMLDASPDGAVYYGCNEPVDRARFRDAVEHGTVTELLCKQSVSAGDVIHVPPGTLHAILKGVFLLEVQQPSDSTFRVYDYGRPGRNGHPRELHLEQALRICDLVPANGVVTGDKTQIADHVTHNVLVCTDHYRIEKLTLKSATAWRIDSGSVQVLFVASGNGILHASDQGPVSLTAGETALIPACLKKVRFEPHAVDMELILCGVSSKNLFDF